jgi:hypothetical protein
MSTSFLTRLRNCCSFLLVPGSQPENFMLNRLGGDAVIVELESAVKREPTANRKLGMTGKDPLHAAQLAIMTRSSLHRRMPNATPRRLLPRPNAGRLGVTCRSARHQTRGAAVKLSEFEPKVTITSIFVPTQHLFA